MTEAGRGKVFGLPAPTSEEVVQARLARTFLEANLCTAVRDLFAGDPVREGTVIQTCVLTYHNDSRAHRMTNPDGSNTTWRS
ncbi:hypothetical protein [Pseudarthrobacter sp. BIM B-2242]|uniref:hypothetical protein n=1 Tax=Pseudarthrobacter sp. BIM B-2242 TaxID=2772401 RepID=UPI00168B564B|nr:hypothetical protein [Pseudarthrobacter sp. BIM B-2242]QOD06011.1 hypothetical protein IDT60_20825 [Pseudarthrobacter sp. BIM B-2242]